MANDTHLLRREHGHSDRSWLLRRNNQPPRPQVLIDNLILEHASQLVAEKGDARYLWGGEGAVVSTCMQGACAARRGNRGRARFLTALVISGHQWSSVVISGHQWSSVVISGHQATRVTSPPAMRTSSPTSGGVGSENKIAPNPGSSADKCVTTTRTGPWKRRLRTVT